MKAALFYRGEEPKQGTKRSMIGMSSKADLIQQKKRRSSDSPLNIYNAHELDDHITFLEGSHEYFVDGQKMRISVTGFIDLFMHPFDQEKILNLKFKNAKVIDGRKVIVQNPKARQKTKDAGCDREDVLNAWGKTAEVGTYYHAIVEKYYMSYESEQDYENEYKDLPKKRDRLYAIDPDLRDPKHQHFLFQFLSADESLCKDGWRIFRVEWRIHNIEESIAGSIDAVFKRVNENGKVEYALVDWKFSPKPFTVVNGWQDYNKVCPHPLRHLPNTKLTRYSLQLNKYRIFLRDCYGIDIVDMMLIKMNPYVSDIFVITHCDFLDVEIQNMTSIWQAYRRAEEELLEWKQKGKLFSSNHPELYYPCYIARPTLGMLEVQEFERKNSP